MSDYVENGYVDSGYVESESVTPPSIVTCDLTVVNTKLDLILTKLSAVSTAVTALDSRLTTIENAVDSIPTDSYTVELSKLDSMLADVRNTVNNELVSIENIKDIVPMVTDLSLRVYPNGTKVDVIGVDGICTVISSSLTPDSDYLFLVEYMVKLDGTDRISQFPSPVITKHIDGA